MPDRERDLKYTDGEGDLLQEREFTFGEEHFDGGLLRFTDVDLDLEREFPRDATSELFLDSATDELLDLDLDLDLDFDLDRDFPEWFERGDRDSLFVTFPSTSGDGDLEGDLELLFLSNDLDLDLDDL